MDLIVSFPMKKSKIWKYTFLHLLLFIAVTIHSSEIGNPITDDIDKISILKQNIPKDYKITVKYIPVEELQSGLCWVKLNVFHLEESLKGLARKFGNISSNRDHINTFIQILREMRYHIGNVLDDTMLEFQCHYREEKWPTGKYFEFVENFFQTANSSRDVEDCESPPCPTEEVTTVPFLNQERVSPSSAGAGKLKDKEKANCSLPKNIEKSLLSLLLIPIMAITVLLAWKIRSKRHTTKINQTAVDIVKGVDDSLNQLEKEVFEEKKCLKVVEVIETL